MSELVKWMEEMYLKAKNKDLEWKPIYPNNMSCNTQAGIYTDMLFKKEDKYQYIKFSIEYKSRCDENGLSHPDEGIKYYVLHRYEKTCDENFEMPKPVKNIDIFNDKLSLLVNEYGRFRYVFDDEETAKSVVYNELLHTIYPYSYILDEDESKQWEEFLDNNKNK